MLAMSNKKTNKFDICTSLMVDCSISRHHCNMPTGRIKILTKMFHIIFADIQFLLTSNLLLNLL